MLLLLSSSSLLVQLSTEGREPRPSWSLFGCSCTPRFDETAAYSSGFFQSVSYLFFSLLSSMPSGRKKRLAARRRRNNGAGTSLDKESVSGSHASDEGSSPQMSNDVNSRLSLATGSNERSADQTFQTEEWVRVSDFDVGTPTSTTAKSDFDTVAEGSYGDVRGHDRIADWETVSRENAGDLSFAEDVGEVRNPVTSGPGQVQGQKMLHVDEVLSDSSVSDKEDDTKSVSSRSDGGMSSHCKSSSSSRGSGRSVGSSSEAYLKKSDDEERLSSIVVVPSQHEYSQESSFAEVASVEPPEDDYHEMIVGTSSSEEKGAEDQASSAIEPASSEDHEEDKYDLMSGVEDQIMEPASSDEQEGRYTLFTDVSNLKELLEQEGSRNDSNILPGSHGSFSSFISSHINESWIHEADDPRSAEVEEAETESTRAEHQTPGQLENEDFQVPDSKAFEPQTSEVKESEHEPETLESHAISILEQNLEERGSTLEEVAQGMEPTTPDKVSEKCSSENPHSFIRSISDEEVFETGKASSSKEVENPSASPSAKEQISYAEDFSNYEGANENIAKEVHDTPLSGGVPESESHELNQLLEIAHSKEIAELGEIEEKILAQEEQELGKGIADSQPLVEVLSAAGDSNQLEEGEMEDFQPVNTEEAPLLKDSPSTVDSGLQIEEMLKDRAPELLTKEVEEAFPKDGFGDEHQAGEVLHTGGSFSGDSSVQIEEPLADGTAGKQQHLLESQSEEGTSFSVDSTQSPPIKELRTTNEGTSVPLINISESKLADNSAGSTKDVEATSLSGNVDTSSAKSEQVSITSHFKREDQGRPIQAPSGIWGCCEPVHWLLANFARRVNSPSIRN